MNTRVKICGLTRPEDVECAIENGVAFLGFIVECPSKRRLTVAEAAKLGLPAKGLAARVAVTVNPDDDLIDRDYIQLHGDETPARAAEIAKQCKVIKAIGIASDADMKTAEIYSGVADFILYDAKPPEGDAIRGGHGIAIDWNIIADAQTPKRFAIAGGLNAKNVARAITATRAPIADVSSGVEAKPGFKDHRKIRAFMRAAQSRGKLVKILKK